jgi:hypothetical protein
MELRGGWRAIMPKEKEKNKRKNKSKKRRRRSSNGTLWTPIICRLRRLIIIFLLLLLIFMTLYMKGKEKNEQADVRK